MVHKYLSDTSAEIEIVIDIIIYIIIPMYRLTGIPTGRLILIE